MNTPKGTTTFVCLLAVNVTWSSLCILVSCMGRFVPAMMHACTACAACLPVDSLLLTFWDCWTGTKQCCLLGTPQCLMTLIILTTCSALVRCSVPAGRLHSAVSTSPSHTHTQTPRQSWYWCHSMKMFVAQVERLQRDTDQYTSYAMAAFSAAVEAAVPLLLQKVCFATCPSMLASRHPQHTVHIFYMYSCCSITAYQARSVAGCCHSNANIDTCLIS